VEGTQAEFEFSRRAVACEARRGVCASGKTVAWHCAGLEESLIGGVRRGYHPADERGASKTSRRQMWALAMDVAEALGGAGTAIGRLLREPTYDQLKGGDLLDSRTKVKEDVRWLALTGWICNQGDSAFGLAQSHSP